MFTLSKEIIDLVLKIGFKDYDNNGCYYYNRFHLTKHMGDYYFEKDKSFYMDLILKTSNENKIITILNKTFSKELRTHKIKKLLE